MVMFSLLKPLSSEYQHVDVSLFSHGSETYMSAIEYRSVYPLTWWLQNFESNYFTVASVIMGLIEAYENIGDLIGCADLSL